MNTSKIRGIVAGAVLAMGLSAPASAVTLVAGDLKFTINAFNSATIKYGESVGTKCTTVAQCDAVAGIKKAAKAVGSEDTWGIFSVQSISRLSDGGLIFTAGQNGEYLTGMFGGVADSYIEVSGNKSPNTLALGTGGWLNMYLNNKNYNAAPGPNGRQGQYGYKGITDIGGKLALSAVLGEGALGGDPEYSWVSNYANRTISGNGQGYLDVTGGMWADMFNTNAQYDPNGNAHDLFLKITYGQTGASSRAGWTVDVSGDVQGKIPEPGSLALLGLGLGLAGLSARRRRA